MNLVVRRRALLPAALGCLLVAIAGCADRPSVLTHRSGLFSRTAVKEAAEQIRDIKAQYDKSILIETIYRVSNNPWTLRQIQAMDAEARKQDFKNRARERAQKAHRDLYILVCAEPVQVEVVAAPQLGDAFTKAERAELAASLRERIKGNENDRGLLEAVQFVRNAFDEHLGGPIPQPVPLSWAVVVWIIVPVLAVWMLLGLIRVLRPVPQGGDPQAEATAFGGGGSLPAGLFATMVCHDLRHFSLRDLCSKPAVTENPNTPDSGHEESAASIHDSFGPETHVTERVHGEP